MKAAVSRSATDLLLIFIVVSLLIPPVPPTALRREIAPPSDEPSGHLGTYAQPAKEMAAEQPAQANEPAPRREPAAAYVVRIGPMSESNAAEIIRGLEAARYSPKTEDGQTEPQRFRVVSGPMRPGDAKPLASTLARRGFPSLVRSLPGDRVEVQFGVFSTPGYAEDLAHQIRGQGYSPTVVREGPTPIITVGLPSWGSVKAIIDIIESTIAPRTLAVVPCGSKEPLTRAWRGWVQVCR